jgi:shikimate dehydrogenase
MTTRLELVGHGISHSLSPKAWNRIFAALDIPYTYGLRDIEETGLAAVIDDLRSGQLFQVHVTMPYKQWAYSIAEERSNEVAITGVSNSLSCKNGVIVSSNTDVESARILFKERSGKNLERILILGAGATAASLTLAALDFSDQVSVTNRNDARTDELIKRDWPKKVHKVLWEDREQAAKESGLIVNTTSVGLVNDDSPLRYWPENSSADLYDLIYRPKLTMIQEQAKASSGVVVDGLSHLQGHIEATMNVLGISLADPRALHNIMCDIAGRPPLRWEKP